MESKPDTALLEPTDQHDDTPEPSEDLPEEHEGEASESEAKPKKRSRVGPGEKLSDDELVRHLAALLFASSDPLGVDRLVQLLDRPRRPRVVAALELLTQKLSETGLPLEVRAIRGGHTLMTSADLGEVVGRLGKGNAVERISPAALETLAVIAYRQPVTKAEVEAIRGVQAGPILRSLVDRGLVRVLGRADVPGHPLQYGTDKEFLDRFGLMDLGDLPRDSELARD
ncbi:MAG: SMC-Scp complex subunit ScpB [Planctomycetota bacterium]|jgi:segregation and condensation protein B|nr:SMC-Scp complex subunit ScpB [Candidatus Woesearchaeota archaeon]MDP6385669.1 SMC-Scp complex subunit ScpB [Planctomycetota bacterium]MDP6739618.1 SMC-Scp complex subunit ScpB [Planctomycetota bacterium]MDP6937917.1 SMC-Scp complex subunit ScpB [Planctomycetota bacterium]